MLGYILVCPAEKSAFRQNNGVMRDLDCPRIWLFASSDDLEIGLAQYLMAFTLIYAISRDFNQGICNTEIDTSGSTMCDCAKGSVWQISDLQLVVRQ